MKHKTCRLLCILTSCMMLMVSIPLASFADSPVTYRDVTGHWGEEAINQWTEYGVVNGDGNGTFRPDDPVTRAEFSKILSELLHLKKDGAQNPAGDDFYDLVATKWYAPYVRTVASYQIMNGYPDRGFHPDENLTREEAVKALAFASGVSTENASTATLRRFSDADEIGSWAAQYVAGFLEKGYIHGMGDGTFAPKDSLTRAQLMMIRNCSAAPNNYLDLFNLSW